MPCMVEENPEIVISFRNTRVIHCFFLQVDNSNAAILE
jgi:hypothetical protein